MILALHLQQLTPYHSNVWPDRLLFSLRKVGPTISKLWSCRFNKSFPLERKWNDFHRTFIQKFEGQSLGQIIKLLENSKKRRQITVIIAWSCRTRKVWNTMACCSSDNNPSSRQMSAPPNQSLKLTEPSVDDFARAKQPATIGHDLPRADWIPSLRHFVAAA